MTNVGSNFIFLGIRHNFYWKFVKSMRAKIWVNPNPILEKLLFSDNIIDNFPSICICAFFPNFHVKKLVVNKNLKWQYWQRHRLCTCINMETCVCLFSLLFATHLGLFETLIHMLRSCSACIYLHLLICHI